MVDYPRDAFALAPSTSVFGLIGFSGDTNREQAQLEFLQPLYSAYADDWWFLSVFAFALIEVGQAEKGKALVEQALEKKPRSAHSAHIYAHALYELGEDQRLASYLEQWLPQYSPELLLSCHLWWHLCLAKLMLGEHEDIWTLYDAHCAPGVSSSPAINVLTDGVSLLWRSELAGQARQTDRWQALLDYQQAVFRKPMVFVDAHGGLPYLAVGEENHFDQWMEALNKAVDDGKLPAGQVPVKLNLAFSAFESGDWALAIEILESVYDEVVRIGGSRAQRDLMRNTLIAAYIKNEQVDVARRFMRLESDRNPSVPVLGL